MTDRTSPEATQIKAADDADAAYLRDALLNRIPEWSDVGPTALRLTRPDATAAQKALGFYVWAHLEAVTSRTGLGSALDRAKAAAEYAREHWRDNISDFDRRAFLVEITCFVADLQRRSRQFDQAEITLKEAYAITPLDDDEAYPELRAWVGLYGARLHFTGPIVHHPFMEIEQIVWHLRSSPRVQPEWLAYALCHQILGAFLEGSPRNVDELIEQPLRHIDRLIEQHGSLGFVPSLMRRVVAELAGGNEEPRVATRGSSLAALCQLLRFLDL